MIVYNVTVKIEMESHEEWLQWMRETHIPQVMETGCFLSYRMHKVLVDDTDGVNYAIQYDCESMERLDDYQKQHAPALQKDHGERYKDRFVAFRTLLEVVE